MEIANGIDSPLAKALHNRRKELGLSLEELSNKVGVQLSYLQRIENGEIIPKPELARELALALQDDPELYETWAKNRSGYSQSSEFQALSQARYPEAREALIELCEDPDQARRLFQGSSIGPLEAALYGLLIDKMASKMADFGFWGFLSPREDPNNLNPDVNLLLRAFFEMLTHPEGEAADYKKLFSELIVSWSYGPQPHRITVTELDGSKSSYRLALVDKEGSIIPALEPDDPFYALYRMMTPQQRADLAEMCRILLRRDSRIEIQAALQALSKWHNLP